MSEKQLGRYKVERKLGEGGMGDVYLGFDPEAERMVAIKTIRPELLDHPKKLQRFQREIDLQQKVKHPNVVAILDRGEFDGKQYLILEYVEGQELADVIPPGGMDISQASHITERVCLAMHDVHELGIIHRDMKPANVLLDGLGNPHIIDFGVAKSLSGEDEVQLTRDGGFVGTLEYASPEQAEGRLSDVDRRSDIFNIGAMLYKLLTGRTPFFDPKKTDPNELRMRIVRDHPIEPRRIRPEIPQDLENIVLKALAKDLDKRYQTCAELAEDLAKFRAGERVRVAYSLKADKLSQWVNQHKGKIATVTAFLVAICGTTAYFADQLHKESAAQQVAAEQLMRKAAGAIEKDPVNAEITADRVLLNYPTNKTAVDAKRKLVPTLAELERAIKEAKVAHAAGEDGKVAIHLANAYTLMPSRVFEAGFHLFEGQWLTTEQAQRIGVLDPTGRRRDGAFFFGGKWHSRKNAIALGYLLYDKANDRLVNGEEAIELGWIHKSGGWISPKDAMARGLIYYDAQLGKFLDPNEAQDRGFSFDVTKKRWLTAEESQAEGRGLMVRGRWYPAPEARRIGYRYNGEKWYHLSVAWRRDFAVGKILCPEQITAIGWGNRETHCAFGTKQGRIFLYEKKDLQRPQQILGHAATADSAPGVPVSLMNWGPRDKWLVAADLDGNCAMYQLAGASKLIPKRIQPFSSKVAAVRIVTSRGQGAFEVAYRKAGKLNIVHVPQDVSKNRIYDLGEVFLQASWVPNGLDMLLANATSLRHFDLKTGKVIKTVPMPFGQAEAFVNVDFVPNGVMAVSVGRQLVLVDPRSGARLLQRTCPGVIQDIAFDSLGESLLVVFEPPSRPGKSVDYKTTAQGFQIQAAGVK